LHRCVEVQEVVDEGEVDNPVGCGCAGAQTVQIVERAALHLCPGGSDGSGRGIRAGEPEDLMTGADELGHDGRYFADKREVLFSGGEVLIDLLVRTTAGVPESVAPFAAAAAGLDAISAGLQTRHDFARKRARIIAATPELQERELIKLASMAAELAEALRGRGVGEPAASLTAEVGIAVFRIAFDRWVGEGNQRDLPALIRASLEELKALTAEGRRAFSASAQP
jgi:hypothetical protein